MNVGAVHVVLDSAAAVTRLRTDRGLRRSLRRVVLPAHGHSADDRLEAAINRAYFTCGCGHGAAAVFTTLAVAGTLWLADAGPIAWTWWKVCLAAFAAAAAGKGIGIALGRRRLDRLLDQWEERLRRYDAS